MFAYTRVYVTLHERKNRRVFTTHAVVQTGRVRARESVRGGTRRPPGEAPRPRDKTRDADDRTARRRSRKSFQRFCCLHIFFFSLSLSIFRGADVGADITPKQHERATSFFITQVAVAL